jgi:predicted HTH domain antitoxin
MRTEKLTFDVPVDILAALKIGTQALETDMRRTLAVRYYKNKRLSLGKSAKLAGMNRLDFMDYLATEGSVVFDHDEGDLQEELKGMNTLKERKIDSVKRHWA